ncbi:MAG: hypothetical protein M3R54_02910, partial [Chloroflexota bacterium]|nr:hypothetical protein [Chloroflexota bacterium]
MDPLTPRPGYPRRLRVAALVLSSMLIAALLALDYFVIGRIFAPGISQLITLVIGIAGVLG